MLIRLGGFEATESGLAVHEEPPFEACENFARVLVKLEERIQFVMGDFVNYVQDRFGEQASQILDESNGWSEATVMAYGWVCKNVHPDDRLPELSFKHHAIVAGLEREDQRTWLARAKTGEDGEPWTTRRLKEALEQGVDAPVVAWWLQVNCGSAKIRKEVQSQLAGKVVEMKNVDRRRLQSKDKASKKKDPKHSQTRVKKTRKGSQKK